MTHTTPDNGICALLLGEFETDRSIVHNVFQRAGWRLIEASDRLRGIRHLRHEPVHVVLADSDLPGWSWRAVLADLRQLAVPPQLVVASRTADDYLWAEVLDIGGYDVLARPLNAEELERVVVSASRQFRSGAQVAGRPLYSVA